MREHKVEITKMTFHKLSIGLSFIKEVDCNCDYGKRRNPSDDYKLLFE